MSIQKIQEENIYTTSIEKELGDSLQPKEWNDISEAVAVSHDKINEIIDLIHNTSANTATTGLSLNTTMEFVGTTVDVIATATCSEDAIISIQQSDGEPESSPLAVKSFSRTFTGVNSNRTFIAGYTIGSVDKPDKHASITFVHPLYYGAADAYTDLTNVLHRATKRTTLAETYNVTVEGTPTYIWFIIPQTMGTIHTAKMGGFDFSLNEPESVQIGEVDYYVYRTPQKQEVGSYSIVLT